MNICFVSCTVLSVLHMSPNLILDHEAGVTASVRI